MKFSWMLCLFLVGCGLAPRKVSLADPEVQSFLAEARTFPREQYGFSPLPTAPATDIRIERTKGGAYDVMLHIYGATSRTIAFRRLPGGYRWIHEQEGFRGPRFYDSPDGRLQETLYLTYEKEAISGSPTDTLRISYFGDDPRLAYKNDLRLDMIEPILIEWGYGKKD